MSQTEYKRIESIRLQREIIDKHYQKAIEAHDKGIPIVWTASDFPAEIIYAMDMIPVYPENLAVMVLVKNELVSLASLAEEEGYIQDICSYARCNLGSIESGISPIGPIPKPDILCVNTVQCFQIMKWFEALSRHFNIPYYVVDTNNVPEYRWDQIMLRKDGDPSSARSATQYMRRQLEEFVTLLEETAHRKMDYDHLREVLERSNRAHQLWFEIMESAANIPSPITLFDLYVAMSVIFNMRGTQEAVDFYEKVKAEIDERVAQKIPAVPGEKIRLHFENMPLWYSFREDRDFFAKHGAALLSNLYLYMYVKHYDNLSDPLGSIAAECERCSYSGWGGVARAKFIVELIDRFHLDGFIMNNTRTCKNVALELPHMAKVITEKTGVPGLIFDADHGDSRFYSEEEVRSAWERYIVMLADMKSGG